MIDERWERVKDLLHRALSLAEEQRGSFLRNACSADEALRLEVESLLAADADAPSRFLNSAARASADARDELCEGHLFEARFVLSRKLGEGGMGQVWLAEQIAPVRRQVALKLIRAGLYDANVLQRFHAERQSLAIMDHPNIAKVFDAGTTAQGQPYFVMEYVPGLPITEYCDMHRLSIARRLELLIRACEGVQHAHQKAIIHRDLKPANILVVEVDGTPLPRIIDFGLAKPTTPPAPDQLGCTQIGQFMGTPGYMSPEQANPAIRDIDTRTDVYALGVILYVLLTGLLPFEAKRHQYPPFDVLLRKLREEDPPAPSTKVLADRGHAATAAAARSAEPRQLSHQLRGDLDWIAMKVLERERERRYATPLELAADLKRHLRDEAVIARPASAAYQLRKFINRHRVAAAVAALVGIFALAASIAGLIAVRKEREAQFERRQALKAQSRLLSQIAAQRLKDRDVAGAAGIILTVLTDPRFAQRDETLAVGVFQEVRAADAELAVLSGHSERVLAAAFSPDGQRIVTGSADKTARIWDARTGAQVAVLTGHSDRLFAASYSPDGARILTASRDRTARVWDAHSGVALLVLTGHAERVDSAAYSPDGLRIVTASWDKSARIWDARTGAPLAQLRGHTDVLYSAAYSPDGAHIVTASQDKTARIWDARGGAPLATLAGHGDYVACAAYSPDGTRIVTASADKTARVWDARSGAQLTVLAGHGDVVYFAAYSPDGGRIVTASWDKTARIWDAVSGVQLAVLSGHAATLAAAAFSPDGTRIVTASQDGTARIWDARIGAQLAVLPGGGELLYDAAYSPDGARIVTASYDGVARLFDARTGVALGALSGHRGAVASAAYSPDGTRIVTASQDKTARIWDAHTGAALAELRGHTDRVYSAAYSPDGTHIATASRDKTARIFDAQSGAPLAVLAGHTDRVYSAAYSPDGTRIVTASRDRTARVWDSATGATLSVLAGHDDEVLSAAYSPDGARIVTASRDRTARVWDSRSGRPLARLVGAAEAVDSAAYSPDGLRIVTASEDGRARIWDAAQGVPLSVLLGHVDAVERAAYSPDGTRLVTASADKTARIWDARVPADVDAQIAWYAAAAPDPLPALDRAELGLPQAAAANRPFDASTAKSSALARGAAREEQAALRESDPRAANALLLRAFALYAQAAESARLAGVPEEAWQHWRRRRASLARVLARAGMMPQTAAAYRAVLASMGTQRSPVGSAPPVEPR